jgi:hypothetical protein
MPQAAAPFVSPLVGVDPVGHDKDRSNRRQQHEEPHKLRSAHALTPFRG